MTLLGGCIDPGPQRTGLPALQIREFQTRTYETTDTAMVMKAVLNALQDEGFVIKTANTELGFYHHEKRGDETPVRLP